MVEKSKVQLLVSTEQNLTKIYTKAFAKDIRVIKICIYLHFYNLHVIYCCHQAICWVCVTHPPLLDEIIFPCQMSNNRFIII